MAAQSMIVSIPLPDPSGRLRPDGPAMPRHPTWQSRQPHSSLLPGNRRFRWLDFYCAACFGLLYVEWRSSMTRAAASANMGMEGAGVRAASLGLPLFPEWVLGTGDGGAVGRCQRRRLGQADGGVGCQAYVPAPPVGYDPPDPGFGAEACDVQDKVAEGMGFEPMNPLLTG